MDYLKELMDSSKKVESFDSKQRKANANFNDNYKGVEESLDEQSFDGLLGGFTNILHRFALTADQLTPDVLKDTFLTSIKDPKMREQVKKSVSPEAILAKVKLNEANVQSMITQNPVAGSVASFVQEAVPYAAAAPVYHQGTKMAQKKLADKLGYENFLTKTAATAAGTMPVTAGVDLLQHRDTEEMMGNQLFDLLLSPIGGKMLRGVGNKGHTPAPQAGHTVDHNAPTAEPMYAKYEHEESATPEHMDTVEKNNVNDEILTRDLQRVSKDTGIKINDEIRGQIEEFFTPKVNRKEWHTKAHPDARRAVGELLDIEQYSNGSFKLASKDTLQSAKEGVDELPLDEGSKATANNIDDLAILKDKTADIEAKIEILNKYETIDPEFPYITKDVEKFLKENPEHINLMAKETIAKIESDFRQSRLVKDTPTSSTVELGDAHLKEPVKDTVPRNSEIVDDIKSMKTEIDRLSRMDDVNLGKNLDYIRERINSIMGHKDKEIKVPELREAWKGFKALEKKAIKGFKDRGEKVPEYKPEASKGNSKLVDPNTVEIDPSIKRPNQEPAPMSKAKKSEMKKAERIAKGKAEAVKRRDRMNKFIDAVDRAKTQEQLDLLVKKSKDLKYEGKYEKFKEKVVNKRKELETKNDVPAKTDKDQSNASDSTRTNESVKGDNAQSAKTSGSTGKSVEPDYGNLKPADKRWMESYDEKAKKHHPFNARTQNKRARLLEEAKKPKVKKESQAEKMAKLSDENTPAGASVDDMAKKRKDAMRKQNTLDEKYKDLTDDDIAEMERNYMDDEDFIKGSKKDDKVPEPKKTEETKPKANKPEDKKKSIDKSIATKRARAKSKADGTEKVRGEIGKDASRFVEPVDNNAKNFDQKSADTFNEPTGSHVEYADESSGYYLGGDVHLQSMTKASIGFKTYVHEVFHKILDTDMMETIIDGYRKNAEGDIPSYNHESMSKYETYDGLVRYEESIVYAATDKFIDSLPANIKERFEFPVMQELDDSVFKTLTPEMQKMIDDLVDQATTALNSKGNYLNEFAHGEKKRIMDKLDDMGNNIISQLIDKSIEKIKNFEKEIALITASSDNKVAMKALEKYSWMREKTNEIIQNIMAQANKLPTQKFIDKITSVSRHTEEVGRNYGDIASTVVKELIPNKRLRESLSPIVLSKDLQSIRAYIKDMKSMADIKAKKQELRKGIKDYVDADVSKVMKQTIKAMDDQIHMNSTNWRHNAYQVLKEGKRFNELLAQFNKTKDEGLKNKIKDITRMMDEYMTLESLTVEDMRLIKSVDDEIIDSILNIHAEGVARSKESMPSAATSMIKGYKPSLFQNYVEFTDKPPLHMKDMDGWKLYPRTGIWYREAIKPDSSRSMFIAKNQIPKGSVWDIPDHIENYTAYAEKIGAGLVNVEGQLKLRKVVDNRFRKEVMKDNLDVAENLGAMFENNVHDKTSMKHDVEILNGINEYNLISNTPSDKMTKMTEKELNLMPIRIRKALHKAYGDEIYIDKTYKEQMIGYSHDIRNMKALEKASEKSGVELTHEMWMGIAKTLDVVAETTQLIKQTIILKNPVVIAGNFMFQNFMALNEGVPVKNIYKYQREGAKDFTDYIKLTEKKIRLEIEGKKDSPEYKNVEKRLKNNVASRLFRESQDGGGIDRNLLVKSLRDKDLSRKHMERWVTEKLGGEDSFKYKTGSLLFITPESLIGSMFVKGLNYTDYLGRSTLMRHYLQKGMSFEDAARKANSKTVSFSKQLPSSIAWAERYGVDHFLTWTLRSAAGLGTSFKEHPARWLAFVSAYYAATESTGSNEYESRYLYDVRTSSFNPTESFLTSMFDGGIYSNIADKGAFAFEPEVIRKVREGKNPILTTK